MPLFHHGKLEDFSAGPSASDFEAPTIRGARLGIASARDVVHFPKTEDSRGLTLKSIVLTEGFEGFLGNIFSPRHEVYFVSWAWDLSGEPPFLHPEADTDPRSVLIPMRVGKVRQFIGDGVLLFPERPVTGGLAVRILLWESDSDVRTLAKTLFSVASTLKNSLFSSLLTTLAGVTSVPTATLAAIAKGALELASAVSSVLQGNGDDYVDFYEGYFAAGHPWKRDEQTYSGEASKIVIART